MDTSSSMPIIPLTSADALPAALSTFQASLAASRAAQPWLVDAARDLLPFCTVNNNGMPLSIRAVDTLSRSCLSFRELLVKGIATAEGRELIRGMLEPAEAERLLSFWTHEFATG